MIEAMNTAVQQQADEMKQAINISSQLQTDEMRETVNRKTQQQSDELQTKFADVVEKIVLLKGGCWEHKV